MKFTRSFHVFVNNFSTTYKLLLYKAIVFVIFLCISVGVAYPIISNVTSSAGFSDLTEHIGQFLRSIINLDGEASSSELLDLMGDDLRAVWEVIKDQQTRIIVSAVIILVLYLAEKFLQAVGHFTSACLIHDRMAMQAKSPFFGTLTKNLRNSSLYAVMYVPMSFLYDTGLTVLLVYLLFFLMDGMWLLSIFLFVLGYLLITMVKMTFTTDWIPEIIWGRKTPGAACRASFSRKGKKSAGVFSNFVVLVLIVMALNAVALFFTLGVGLIITVPSSYIIFLCFGHVNYCTDNDIGYFLDRDTPVRPRKEKPVSREDFFRGDN